MAFDVAENLSFGFLNIIWFGGALFTLIGFFLDALDLFRSGTNS